MVKELHIRIGLLLFFVLLFFVCCSVAFSDVMLAASPVYLFFLLPNLMFFSTFCEHAFDERLLVVLKPLSMDSVIDGERYFCMMLLFQVRPWCDSLHHNRKVHFCSYNYSRTHFVEARTCHNNKITWTGHLIDCKFGPKMLQRESNVNSINSNSMEKQVQLKMHS